MTRVLLVISLAAVAALLSACGGSTTTVVHTDTQTVTEPAPTTPTPTTTTNAGTTPTGTTPTGTTTTGGTTIPGGTPTGGTTTTGGTTVAQGTTVACTSGELTPTYLGSNGATGNIVLSFAIRNRSAKACHTYGFPGVQFVARNGSSLTTSATRTTQDILGSTPESELVLEPGQRASFRMVASDSGPGGGASGCVTAYAVQVIAPDDTVPMRVAIPGGTVECGKTGVSPLLAGSDAVPGV
jgi:hypothetical protein